MYKKIEILLQNKEDIDKEIAKSVQKDAKDIFETIRLNRSPKTSFTDIVFIAIRIQYNNLR